MKTFKTIVLLSVTGVLVGACGAYKKEPVEDLEKIRQNAIKSKAEADAAELDRKRRDAEWDDAIQNRGREEPQILTKEIVVEKEIPVYKEQATINEKYVVISREAEEMSFTEGQSTSYKFHASSLVPGMKIQLTAQNLPEGAKLLKTAGDGQADVYTLTWSPPLYTVAPNSAIKLFKFKLLAQVTEVPAGKNKTTLQNLMKEKEATLFVMRSQKPPTNVTAEGLPTEVDEGSSTPFSITVLVPGVDNQSPEKPRLKVTSDGQGYVAGSEQLELDGSRHIIPDQAKPEPEYIGDFKWKFNLIFDTENISIRPPVGKDKNILTNATSAAVRMLFKVYSPFGAASADLLKQLKIQLAFPISTPRFDLSAIGAESLALTPGQLMKLNFIVKSAHPRSTVQVQIPDLKSLKGAPSIVCKANPKSAAQQDCVLNWKVPCDATDAELTNEIKMSAVATLDGKNTDVMEQTLKTSRSSNPKVNCRGAR